MEALVLIFAEILFACLAPVVALMGGVFAALLEGVVLLLSWLSLGSGSRRKPVRTPARPADSTRRPLVSRKFVHWGAAIIAGLGVAGLAASVLLFEPIVRTVLTAGAARAGVEARFASASGSLLTGHVRLQDVRLARDGGSGPGFELAVDSAAADVDLWSLLGSEPRIEFAEVTGVTGFVVPPDGDRPRPRRQRRPFRADMVSVSAVDVEVRPRGGTPYGLKIETAEVAPLRSRLALFDLLFRSNLRAEIAGQPLLVETRPITADGRETRWRFEDVEADKLKLVVPKRPLTWFAGGRLGVVVDDSWSLSEDWVDMDWRVRFDGVEVTPPPGAGAGERTLAAGLGRLVAARGGDAEIGYRLQLGPEDMARLRSGDLGRFWDVVLSGFVTGEAEAAGGEDTGDAPGRLGRALDRLRSKLRGDGE